MNITYCILGYNDPELLARSVNMLNTPNTRFIIHIQKSIDIKKFKKLLPESYFIPDKERIDTIWGDITCVKAELLLFRKAVQFDSKGVIVLMSGSDYPIKSNSYIYSYFENNYPTNYFAFMSFKEMNGDFKKLCKSNRDNYWISFSATKCKIEVKPFKYIRFRCISKVQDIPFIQVFTELPKLVGMFFIPKKLGKYRNLDWCTSETWMELSDETVKKLIKFIDENPEYLELGKYIHNPEEMLLQSAINTIECTIPRCNYVVNCETRSIHNGSLEILNKDEEFVKEKVNNKNWLFMRKFSSERNSQLLNLIDSIRNK